MLKKIYEVIADKTLSFGCQVEYQNYFGRKEVGIYRYSSTQNEIIDKDDSEEYEKLREKYHSDVIEEDGEERIVHYYKAHFIINGSVNEIDKSSCPNDICEHGKTKITRVIGHPIHIGYIMNWLITNSFITNKKTYQDLIFYWKKPELPIDEQSEECQKFIIKLIEKYEKQKLATSS